MAENEIIVPDIDKNANRCLCPGCPTHNECMKNNEEKIFCSRGKTECNPEEKGCLCGTCPVEQEYGLNDFYYCINGAAKR
ncbi:MAG: DUF2769 domain-containing protein [Methanobacterium sp.]